MADLFCGWYLKCQSDTCTLALIPAVHGVGKERSCSIQLITDDASWSVPFPASALQAHSDAIHIGASRFSRRGVRLDLHAPGLDAAGSLIFGPFTPIRYDIMGPFRYVPFLECRHSVFSMRHRVDGEVRVNGVPYVFYQGTGYAEGDRGRSFPREYAWTQCSFPEGSLMLSVADIPLLGCHFTGVIGIVLWQGREYRLATYLGARAVRRQDRELVVRQGGDCLTARLPDSSGRALRAPSGGAMMRTIREHAACRAFYRFERDGRTLFAQEAPNASFEYEYPQ